MNVVLLIAADDLERARLGEALEKAGFKALPASRPPSGPADGPPPAAIVADLEADGADAAASMQSLAAAFPGAPVIALAEDGDEDRAARAMRLGAADFIAPRAGAQRLAVTLHNALAVATRTRAHAANRPRAASDAVFASLVAASPEMSRALDLARRLSLSSLAVLLQGEKGVGRETLARAVHDASARRDAPFVKLAFSAGEDDAAQRFATAFAAARDGSLYIDDVAAAPPALQIRLSALLSGEGQAKGARILCATERDLVEEVKAGRMREDLFYRLSIMPISLPPLRSRPADVAALAERFMLRFASEEDRRLTHIEPAAISLLQRYGWPGNAAQLQRAVFRAVMLAAGPALKASDFPHVAMRVEADAPEPPPEPKFTPRPIYKGPAMIGAAQNEFASWRPAAEGASRGFGVPALNEEGDIRPLHEIEADMIRLALGHYRGHMTEVARRLGIGRSTLYRKMREFGLDFRVH